MDEFEIVRSLKTEINNYRVGDAIKFWDTGDRTWIKGGIIEIVQCAGYLVNVNISYHSRDRQRQVRIYREDWLKR